MTREEQRVWDLSYCPRFSFTLSLLPHPSFLPSILTSSFLCPFSTLVPSLKHHSILPSDYLHPTILPSALVLLTQAFFFHCPFSPCVPSIFLCSCPSLSWYFSLLPSFSPSLYLSLFYSVPSFLPHFFNVTLSLPIVIPLTLSVSKVRGKSSTNRKTFHTESNLRHFWNTSGSSTVSTQTQAQRDLNQQPVCVHSCASADQVADKASASSD